MAQNLSNDHINLTMLTDCYEITMANGYFTKDVYKRQEVRCAGIRAGHGHCGHADECAAHVRNAA